MTPGRMATPADLRLATCDRLIGATSRNLNGSHDQAGMHQKNMGRVLPARPMKHIRNARQRARSQADTATRVRDTALRVAFLRDEPARDGILHKPQT